MKRFSYQIKRRHFHTFDALRFFAFFKVFLLHIPILVFPWFNFIIAGGGIGVQFFFVLSGFLITYIICEEKQQTGKLDLKNFFVRRILRIWPLYYLMVLVAYITPYILSHFLQLNSSSEGYEPELWISVLFLENYKMMITHSHANVSPLSVMWSLCIEEHFYLIWGLLLYRVNIRALPKLLGFCIGLSLICRIIYVHYNIPTSDILTNIDLFAFGAIPAYLLITYNDRFENYILRIPLAAKWLFLLVLIATVFTFSQFDGDDRPFIWMTSILGLLFSVLLCIIIPARNPICISDKNILTKAGVYTYGLYMYHTLVINLLRQIFLKFGWNYEQPGIAFLFFLLGLGLSFACAIISYKLFELPFLKLKRYFR